MSATDRLLPEALRSGLARLRGWGACGDQLRARYKLPSFAAAVSFTVQIAEVAEELQHHPEWSVVYREVEVSTTTHDVGALTPLDLALAERVQAIADRCGATPVAGPAG